MVGKKYVFVTHTKTMWMNYAQIFYDKKKMMASIIDSVLMAFGDGDIEFS